MCCFDRCNADPMYRGCCCGRAREDVVHLNRRLLQRERHAHHCCTSCSSCSAGNAGCAGLLFFVVPLVSPVRSRAARDLRHLLLSYVYWRVHRRQRYKRYERRSCLWVAGSRFVRAGLAIAASTASGKRRGLTGACTFLPFLCCVPERALRGIWSGPAPPLRQLISNARSVARLPTLYEHRFHPTLQHCLVGGGRKRKEGVRWKKRRRLN